MRRHARFLSVLALIALFSPSPASAREKWRPVTPEELSQTAPKVEPGSVRAARYAIAQTRSADDPPPATGPDWAAADAEADPDDVDADHQGLSSAELLQRELGAQMIEEIRHQ